MSADHLPRSMSRLLRAVPAGLDRQRKLAVLVVGLVALSAALYRLGDRGLWGDEIAQVSWSVQRPLGAMLSQTWVPPDLPLNFFLVRIAAVLGTDALVVRLPEALLGVAAALVLFVIGSREWGRPVGLTAGLLLAVAPLHVWYAQEARPYAGLSFYSLLALCCFLRLHGRWSWVNWLGLVAACTFDIYNHLFGLFPVGVLVLTAPLWTVSHAIRRSRERTATGRLFSQSGVRFVWAVWTAVAVGILLSFPLWSGIFSYLRAGAPGEVAPPPFVPTPAFVGDLFSLYGAGSGWRLAVFAGLFAIGFVSALLRRPSMALVTAAWLGMPFVVLTVVQPHHIFIPRYFLFLQPVYLLMVAYGLVAMVQIAARAADRLQTKWSRAIGPMIYAGAVVALLAVAFRTTWVGYRVDKPNDWGSLCSFLDTNTQPGDTVTGNSYARLDLSWCLRDRPELFVPGRDEPPADLSENGQNIWYVDVVPGSTPPAGFVPIPNEVWARTDLLQPATYQPFKFPVSESLAQLYYQPAPKLPTHLTLRDVVGSSVVAGWPDYGQIGPGEQRTFRVAREPSATSLLIRFLNAHSRDLEVWVDHTLVGVITTDRPDETWTTRAFAIPAWAGPMMEVELRNTGRQPAGIAEIGSGP